MEEKKNIAFFGVKYFPSRGGTSRVVENLILNLRNDYNITIYCYKNKLAKSHIKGVTVIEFPEIKLGSAGVFLYYLICYFHIRIKGRYDIIHAHKIDSFYFLNGLSKKAKVIATAHEAPYKRDKWSRFAKAFFKVCENRFLNFKGVQTAISKPLCEFYKENHGVKVLFVPNGINLFEKGSDDSTITFATDKAPLDNPFVLFAARRIMGTKGLHTMLKAYKKIDYQGNILIAGEMDNYPTYFKQIKQLSEGLNVYFLGFINSLPALLDLVGKCEYFVFPSEVEGMSIMLLEVASVGKPILASNIPENTQIFDKEDVLYFENKDVNDLSEKILWAENNKSAFALLGANAKKRVNNNYTWDKIANEYILIYEGLF